jgi:uncharacterized membrane protein
MAQWLVRALAAARDNAASPPIRKDAEMYLVAIGWLYVALMMALAEAFHPQGGVLGAMVTFVLYGLLPVSIVMYVMGTPMRRRARLAAEQTQAATSATPVDTGTDKAPVALVPTAAAEPVLHSATSSTTRDPAG